MIEELKRKRRELHDMKDKFQDQASRAKELILKISDNKEMAEELANLLFELGGDIESVNNAIKDNGKGLAILLIAKSLG